LGSGIVPHSTAGAHNSPFRLPFSSPCDFDLSLMWRCGRNQTECVHALSAKAEQCGGDMRTSVSRHPRTVRRNEQYSTVAERERKKKLERAVTPHPSLVGTVRAQPCERLADNDQRAPTTLTSTVDRRKWETRGMVKEADGSLCECVLRWAPLPQCGRCGSERHWGHMQSLHRRDAAPRSTSDRDAHYVCQSGQHAVPSWALSAACQRGNWGGHLRGHNE
jgi:hypothetical protein